MISYIGGKSRIGKWIVPFYDKNMETYVEVFGGMFWCFYNMGLKEFPNLKKVVYNDFNPLNYNLFKCIQNPTELLKAINSIDCQKFGEEVTPSIGVGRVEGSGDPDDSGIARREARPAC